MLIPDIDILVGIHFKNVNPDLASQGVSLAKSWVGRWRPSLQYRQDDQYLLRFQYLQNRHHGLF